MVKVLNLLICSVFLCRPPGQAESPGFRQPGIHGAAQRDGGPVGQLLLRPLLPGGQTETAGAGQQGGAPGEGPEKCSTCRRGLLEMTDMVLDIE